MLMPLLLLLPVRRPHRSPPYSLHCSARQQPSAVASKRVEAEAGYSVPLPACSVRLPDKRFAGQPRGDRYAARLLANPSGAPQLHDARFKDLLPNETFDAPLPE